MKKNYVILIMLCCIITMFFVSCASKIGKGNTKHENDADYSAYPFSGKQWMRNTECDVETLCFLANGEFRYSCACGNSVNDADVVESYSYDNASKTFILNCYEEIDGMITKIRLISCDGKKLELDFNGEIRTFLEQSVYDENAEDSDFKTDLTKISPMIQENVQDDVVNAARTVIDAFLRYENSVVIDVSGNSQRFMNDMAYVIHCTCPLFGAFTDFSEISSYDAKSGKISWNFYYKKKEFDSKLQEFDNVVNTLLSNVEKTDSETMRAMCLYYAIIDDLSYNDELLGVNFEKLNTQEANLKSSPYYVLLEKSGICTNIAQAYMFLCTQADITCGTVLHMGGSGMHMWNIILIDGMYYYCDPTWDANSSLKHFGITAADRASWAGAYSADDGTMLSITIPQKYQVVDSRFDMLRKKLPVELSEIKVDRITQTITFVGYEYEYVFECI